MTCLVQRREFNGGVMFDWKIGERVVATIAIYAEGLVEFQGEHMVAIEDVSCPEETIIVNQLAIRQAD